MPPGPKTVSPTRNAVHKLRVAQGSGWQHGKRPSPPSGLCEQSVKAWQTWLSSWWAPFYTPDDLPGLEMMVRQFDRVCKNEVDIAKIVPLLDRYGVTPKGRQDLRWVQAEPDAVPRPAVTDEVAAVRAARKAKLA